MPILSHVSAWCGLLCLLVSTSAVAEGEELARTITAFMLPASAEPSFRDWRDLDAVTFVHWQPLPPNMLDDGLPDGSYFTRRGLAKLDGRPVGVVATGARTMVMNLYFRNVGAPIGDGAVITPLERLGIRAELVRCPIAPATSGDRWWRISGAGKRAAILQSQTTCNGKACEGYALLLGGVLLSMSPQEREHYTDRCAGPQAGTALTSLPPWDEQLAAIFDAWIRTGATSGMPWNALGAIGAIRWQPLPPRESTQPWKEPYPYRFALTGEVDLGGRLLQATATGDQATTVNLYFEDQHTHASRGNVLASLQIMGYQVRLLRCGKVYTRSSRNWYELKHASAPDAVLDYGLRCDSDNCPRAQESFFLSRRTGLPPLQPGEVTAVAGRCPGR